MSIYDDFQDEFLTPQLKAFEARADDTFLHITETGVSDPKGLAKDMVAQVEQLPPQSQYVASMLLHWYAEKAGLAVVSSAALYKAADVYRTTELSPFFQGVANIELLNISRNIGDETLQRQIVQDMIDVFSKMDLDEQAHFVEALHDIAELEPEETDQVILHLYGRDEPTHPNPSLN